MSLSILACKSLVGIRYTYIPQKHSLSLIPSNDTTAVLYFANTMPVILWKYHSFYQNGRLRRAIVDTVEILDKKLYDNLEKYYSRSINDKIVSVDDTVLIHNSCFILLDNKGHLKSRFYNLRNRIIKRIMRKPIIIGDGSQ